MTDAIQAIDTPSSVSGRVASFVSQGYYGFIRYVSANTNNFPEKQLTADEVATIQSYGDASIGLVFESSPIWAEYFTSAQGMSDAQEALGVVAALGVPNTVPIFYAVDFDASGDEIDAPILSYFQSVGTVHSAAGRPVGVYGSGLVCSLLKNHGVVTFTWLAQSAGWEGYSLWLESADIVQNSSTTIDGLSLDTDSVRNVTALWTA